MYIIKRTCIKSMGIFKVTKVTLSSAIYLLYHLHENKSSICRSLLVRQKL